MMPPLATIGLDDVTPTRVPTLVSDELTTEDPRVVLVRTLAVESRSKARNRPSAELETTPVDVTVPTLKDPNVPTLVKEEPRTVDLRVVWLRT